MKTSFFFAAFAALGLSLSFAPLACSSSSSTPNVGPGGDGGGPPTPAPGDDGGVPPNDSGGGGNDAPSEASPGAACTATGAALTVHPCAGNLLGTGDVPKGCAPSVDGTLHADEWADAACFDVAGDMAVYVKYAGDSVYLATLGNPSCGCGMPFYFGPDGAAALSATDYAISVFDDPFMPDGDRSDFTVQNGAFTAGKGPAGIVTRCKGNQPMPIAYEWQIPFAALGITAGSAHGFRFAINHNGKKWPSTLTLNATGLADDPSTWGTLQSASWN